MALLGDLISASGAIAGIPTGGLIKQLGYTDPQISNLYAAPWYDLLNAPFNPAQNQAATTAPIDVTHAAASNGVTDPGANTNTVNNLAGTNQDPGLIGQYKTQIAGMAPLLNDLYSQLNTGIDQYAQDRRGQVDQSYATALQNDQNYLQNASNNTDAAFTARNAFDSSFRGNAQDFNRKAFDSEIQNLNQNRDNSYAQIGGVVAQNKAAIAQKPQYDLSQYNDVQSLQSLRDQLDSHIQNLTGMKNNLLTQGQLKTQLDQVAPPKSDLATGLKARLDALASANTPPEAKYGLGQGYINMASLSKPEQDKWTTYLMGLLNPTAA